MLGVSCALFLTANLAIAQRHLPRFCIRPLRSDRRYLRRPGVHCTQPISHDDSALQRVFYSFRLESDYTPSFSDVVFYAQVLFEERNYPAAAPVFEKALSMVPSDGSPFKSAAIAHSLTASLRAEVQSQPR
jgi:hypothetical protein